MDEPSETRELDLIGKVEFRIAFADSDDKLSALLKIYLAPLLLKLTSRSQVVRDKVISVCQHINNRVKSPSIVLPVLALVKQFRDVENALVRHFDLLYIQQGIERLDYQRKIELFLEVLKALSVLETETSNSTASASVFNIFLKLLPLFKLPARGTKEDLELRSSLDLPAKTWTLISVWLTKFLLLDPSGRSCGLSQADEVFLQLNKNPGFWASGEGNNLIQTKTVVAKFLASCAFTDDERFIAAVILSADNNAALMNIGDIMFKQHSFDLEDVGNVDGLFNLYFGQREEPSRLPARPKLQIRILSLLSKSKLATSKTANILRLPGNEFSGLARASGLEASKLQAHIFSFITWVTRVGSISSLEAIAPQTVRDLRGYIEHQGWPSPQVSGTQLTPSEVNLRSHAYESIGILCSFANAFQDLELVRWLFTALRCDITDNQIFVSIEGALGRALNALTFKIDNQARDESRLLLGWHMQTEIGQVDADTGYETKRSTKFAAVRFANRCLFFDDVYARWIDILAIRAAQKRQELAEEGRKGLNPYQFCLLNPDIKASFRLPVFRDLTGLFFEKHGQELKEPLPNLPNALGPAVEFVRNVLLAWALSTKLPVHEEAEWDRKLDGLIRNDDESRALLASYIKNVDSDAFLLLLKTTLSGLCADQGRCGEYLIELLPFSSEQHVEALFPEITTLIKVALSNNQANQLHAARVIGIISSSPQVMATQRQEILMKLPDFSANWINAIGEQVNRVRGSILTKAYIFSRVMLRRLPEHGQEGERNLLSQLLDILSSRDAVLREAAQIALGEIFLCENLMVATFAYDNWEKLTDSLIADSKKGHEVAVRALGRLCYCISSSDPGSQQDILQKLRELHETRQAELHFSVGEALSVAVAGWHSSALLTEHDVDARHPKLDQVADTRLISSTVEKTIEDCKNPKPSLRKAAAIWLLCMVQFCGHLDGVKQNLRNCQAAFGGLLSDRDEVVQESGSRGLGLVFEMGDESIKRDLVRDLVQSFTATTAKLGGKVNEDTVLFDEGALPTGDGTSVKTYGEVVKLAQEVGQPSLVYQFMNLAANNAIWTSRAAFGRFGISNVLANSTLLSENPAFYPKLYRYRFDPNPNVQRSMNDIWTALVKDTNAILELHFDTILNDLLKSIVGREWRVREASCAAIADLIQGREIQKYEPYLNEIWTLAFKVGLDDIKVTVRVAGMSLIRTLVNISLHSLEVGDGQSNRAQVMLSQALPFLLQQLSSGPTKDAQEYAVTTMVKIVKKAASKSLEPFAPRLIETLLTSLTSLEPEMINYIHLNAAKYGLTSAKIDKARVTGMGSSPIMEGIEGCLDSLNEGSIGPSMTAVENAIKVAIGLPSKVGCSRAIISLCVRHTFIFRPYADRFAQLIRKQILDRNETVSISYSMSLAYLTRVVTDEEMENIIAFIQQLYFDSQESAHRAVSGEIVQSMSKIANDRFMHFASGLLPIAYVAKNDSEQQIKDLFDKTWKDNVGGPRSVTLYLPEIQSLTEQHIGSPRWAIKHAAAKAIAELVVNFEGDFTVSQAEGVWKSLEKALSGKTWDGKENIVTALPLFTAKSKILWAKIGSQMKTIAVREAKRTNVKYRPAAITALGDFARICNDIDLLSDIIGIAQNILDEILEDSDDKMEIDGETSLNMKLRGETAVAILHAILWNLAVHRFPDITITGEVVDMLQKSAAVDPKMTRQTLYEGTKVLFEDAAKISVSVSAGDEEKLHALRQACWQLFETVVMSPLGEGPVEPETLRIKRAEAALAYGNGTPVTREQLTTLTPPMRKWANEERSPQVCQLLEKALRILNGKT